MKFPVTLRVPLLGLVLEGEVELSEELLAPRAAASPFLTDRDLRARWRCSARTIKRLRDERRLPYRQPTPRRFLYAPADVERYETEHRTDAGTLRPRQRRAAR